MRAGGPRRARSRRRSTTTIGDDLLRLMFIACHPVLSHRGARRADAAPARRADDRRDRARVPRARADRRAAHRARQAHARRGARAVRGAAARRARATRLASVLEVDLPRSSTRATRPPPATTGCARRCARKRCGSAASSPSSRRDEPEVHGLVALMEIQASRSRARVGPTGEPVLLLDQDRARWDRLLIRRGLAALERAEALGGARGPYALQAAIAACHARAATRRRHRLGADRRALRRARAGRAIAGRRAEPRGRGRRWRSAGGGPRARRRARGERALRSYHLLPSVRGDLLAKLGRFEEARAEFERAAALTRNARERRLLLERAAACAHAGMTNFLTERLMTYMLLVVEPQGDRARRTPAEGQVLFERMAACERAAQGRKLLWRSQLAEDRGDARVARARRHEPRDRRAVHGIEGADRRLLSHRLPDARRRSDRAECPAAQWASVEVREIGPCFE